MDTKKTEQKIMTDAEGYLQDEPEMVYGPPNEELWGPVEESGDSGEEAEESEESEEEPELLEGPEATVHMSIGHLFRYQLMHFYTSIQGWVGIALSVLCLITFFCMPAEVTVTKILFLVGGLFFTVLNPLYLWLKSAQLYGLNPVFKKPITYTFAEEGLQVCQESQVQRVDWKQIYRVRKGLGVLVIYTNARMGSVIGDRDLGEQKEEIMTALATGCVRAGVKRIPKSIAGYAADVTSET